MSKQQDAAELETVLRGVVAGSAWFPPRILGAVLRELRADIDSALYGGDLLSVLSRREREVLLGMVQGKQARQIGAELMISLDTVRTHTRNVFAKLDVHSRLEAVRIAHLAGMRADGPLLLTPPRPAQRGRAPVTAPAAAGSSPVLPPLNFRPLQWAVVISRFD